MPARPTGGNPLSERGTHRGSGFKINLTSGSRRGHSGRCSLCTANVGFNTSAEPRRPPASGLRSGITCQPRLHHRRSDRDTDNPDTRFKSRSPGEQAANGGRGYPDGIRGPRFKTFLKDAVKPEVARHLLYACASEAPGARVPLTCLKLLISTTSAGRERGRSS